MDVRSTLKRRCVPTGFIGHSKAIGQFDCIQSFDVWAENRHIPYANDQLTEHVNSHARKARGRIAYIPYCLKPVTSHIQGV